MLPRPATTRWSSRTALIGACAPSQRRVQELGREGVAERLGAEPEREERSERLVVRAAARHVPKRRRSVYPTIVPSSSSQLGAKRPRGLLARGAAQEVPGHAQVDGERRRRRRGAAAGTCRGARRRSTARPVRAAATVLGQLGANEPHVVDAGVRDRPALDVRSQARAHGLDLGQLGHRRYARSRSRTTRLRETMRRGRA